MMVRMTVPVAKVLAGLLAEPAGDHYGLQLMQQTGLASGTLYPILARLQAAGWVDARWEAADPSDLGRPARRYYRLTADGVRSARAALAELHDQTASGRRPTPRAVRPKPAGGSVSAGAVEVRPAW